VAVLFHCLEPLPYIIFASVFCIRRCLVLRPVALLCLVASLCPLCFAIVRYPLLITGVGRSGTKFMQESLNALGAQVRTARVCEGLYMEVVLECTARVFHYSTSCFSL
jgi:hypothetical protein